MKAFFTGLIIYLLACGTAAQAQATGPSGQVTRVEADTGKTGDRQFLNQNIAVDSFDLRIIPPSSGVRFYEGNLVFLSASKDELKMSPSHLSFGTIQAYFAPVVDSTTGPHRVFSPFSSMPFSFPTEAMTFSKDGHTLYFTKISKNDHKEKIYKADKYTTGNNRQGWSWGNQPLSFCTDTFSYTHPALSNNGNLLIFASDKPGSMGGMDLYVSNKTTGEWSSPENLGSSFNTKGNEMFPFLDDDNNLYYSSDKLPGYGGYDIFICRFNGRAWDKPVNMSDRINTENDDIAFTLDPEADTLAFYTVRQKSAKLDMQMYEITLKERPQLSDNQGLSTVLFHIAQTSKNLVAETSPTKVSTQHADTLKAEIKSPGIVKDTTTHAVPKTMTAKTERNEKTPVVKEQKTAPAQTNKTTVSEKPATVVKPETEKTTVTTPGPKPETKKDVVVYRVQFAASTKPKGSYTIKVEGKAWKTWEYRYKGAYRSCIGRYDTLEPAKNLQNTCRKAGYPQAFVVVFVNGVRTVDPKYFR